MMIMFFKFFMKSYVVGTHYNHLADEMLICTNSHSFFYEEISKAFPDSFYCVPFLLGDGFTKDSQDSPGKKQLTIIYCEEIIQDFWED